MIDPDIMQKAQDAVSAWLRDERTTTGVKMAAGYKPDVLIEHIATAMQEIADRQKLWPIETAPKDGTLILTYWPKLYGMEKVSLRSWQHGDWGQTKEGWADCWMQIKPNDASSHWMPLPEPPKEEW